MNGDAPRPRLALPPHAPPRDLLAALAKAGADTSDPTLRTLLGEAHEALQNTALDADAAHQRYQALFDAVPDPVTIIAYDGTVLAVNKAGIAAYQRPREEIVGRSIERLTPDLP